MLGVLGLSQVEEELYEALVARSQVTRAELDDLAAAHGWGEQVTAALDRLQALDLVTRLASNPPSYAAIPPRDAFDDLLVARDLDLARARQRARTLTRRFHSRAGSDDDPLVEVVQGRAAIARVLTELREQTRDELCGFDAPPYIGGQEGNITRAQDDLSGVSYRFIYDPEAVRSPGRSTAIVRTVREPGHQLRVAAAPIKMFLADHRVAVLPVTRLTAPAREVLVVRDPALLSTLYALFDLCWERALPLHLHLRHRRTGFQGTGDPKTTEDLAAASATGETDVDGEVLSMLVAGFTDRDIAVHLGWTDRTIGARVRAMMRQLDADTRFQAGYRLVTRGWLTVRPDGLTDPQRP